MIPLDFPPAGTVRYYFHKWNEDGTLLEIHDTLRRKVRVQQGRNPEPTACIIDSQTVKTTEAGGERDFDGGKQVNGRKRHLTVDTEGNLLVVHVHPANIQDRDGAEPVLAETHDLCPTVSYGWADQGYAGELVEWAAALLGITLSIVKRPTNQQGFVVLARRWVVERSIAWLNRCRRLSKDFEHHLKNSEAMVYWASIQHMLRRLAPPPNQERPYTRTSTVAAR
jgi:putative transposase